MMFTITWEGVGFMIAGLCFVVVNCWSNYAAKEINALADRVDKLEKK